MKCVCCGNSNLSLFEDIKYSKFGSMNYPKEMDDCSIKYCNICSFSFCYPDVEKRRLNLYYEKYYNGKSSKSDSHLDNSIVRDLFFDERSISQISLINQFIDIDNKKILDIGSGSAIFYLQLNRIGYKNSNKYIIEPQVKNKKWYSKNSIKIIEEDIFKIDKKYNNFFDLVFLSHSLEHFNAKDAEELIAIIYKLLKRNGKVFIEVPNANLKEYSNSNENMQPHLSFFTKKSLVLLLESKSIKVKYSGLFGDSQRQKKFILEKDNFYLNQDNMYIHKESERNANDLMKLRKFYYLFFKLISFVLTKKIQIFLKDFYSLFIKKKKLNMNKREFKINDVDGEFLRVIGEKYQ